MGKLVMSCVSEWIRQGSRGAEKLQVKEKNKTNKRKQNKRKQNKNQPLQENLQLSHQIPSIHILPQTSKSPESLGKCTSQFLQ